MAVVFVFVDGVGLGPAGADNPLASVPMPVLHDLLGGPLTAEHVQQHPDLLLAAIDATLGVAGLPQSGTGHTALLTGQNAAVLHGRHQPAYPPVALRPLLAETSLFHQVAALGKTALFANPFSPGYWEAVASRRIRRSASVIAAEGAQVPLRSMDDLREGRAVAWDITNAAHRAAGIDVPTIAPRQAGINLAAMANDADLVFYENFLSDYAGHGRGSLDVGTVLAQIDALLGGVLAALRPGDTLLLTSDHGNIESIAAPSHTTNPVPLLVVGPGAHLCATVSDIAGITPAILRVLTATR